MKEFTIESTIEKFKPINEGIESYRKEYKVSNRSGKLKILQQMLFKDFGVKIPLSRIDLNRYNERPAYYVKGKLQNLLQLLSHRAYLSGVIDTLKQIQDANCVTDEVEK